MFPLTIRYEDMHHEISPNTSSYNSLPPPSHPPPTPYPFEFDGPRSFELAINIIVCIVIWLLKWCKNVILHNIYSINPFVYAIKTFMHSIIQHVDAIIAFVDSILQHVYAIKAFMHLIIQYGWEIVLPLCSFTQTDYVIKLSISTKQ